MSIYKKLKEYLENTSEDQIKKDWEATKELDISTVQEQTDRENGVQRLDGDLLEFMTFGSLFYTKDQEGNFMRATRVIMNDVGEGNNISTSEIVERYKQLLGEEGFKKLVDNERF